MLCLACGSAEPETHSRCAQCDSLLGISAEGQGYLPQLLHLQELLQAGALSCDLAEDRLLRLDEELGAMIAQLDGLGEQILGLSLEDGQTGTIAGFLSPARESLVQFREVAANLSLGGDWSDSEWLSLKNCQGQLLKANQGIDFLYKHLAQLMARHNAP